jgi:hypothetical protein
MTIDTDPGFWKWLTGSLIAAGGSMFGYHKYLIGRIDKKADKEAVARLETEVTRVRDMQARTFEQIRENEQRATDRHERLLERLPPR